MNEVKKQISDFIDKCEEVKTCKFIVATTKIKDLLKSIVNSRELYELFNTVSSNFDYNAAKERCFVEAEEGSFGRSYLILPDSVGDRLAFVFCLLVEFDRGTINFNAFLQKYYAVDGSYFSSYHAFCDEVIDGFEKIICDVFSKELASGEEDNNAAPREIEARISAPSPSVSMIETFIDNELHAVSSSALSEDDKEAGTLMLGELKAAVKGESVEEINAIVCGYNYFALYTKTASETLSQLFDAIGEYVEGL